MTPVFGLHDISESTRRSSLPVAETVPAQNPHNSGSWAGVKVVGVRGFEPPAPCSQSTPGRLGKSSTSRAVPAVAGSYTMPSRTLGALGPPQRTLDVTTRHNGFSAQSPPDRRSASLRQTLALFETAGSLGWQGSGLEMGLGAGSP